MYCVKIFGQNYFKFTMDELKGSSCDIESFYKDKNEDEKHKCHICGKDFDKNALEIHYLSCQNFKCESNANQDNDKVEKHKCHICEKDFNQLEIHFLTCHNDYVKKHLHKKKALKFILEIFIRD